MPKWNRYLHRSACGFMCLLFTGLGLLNLHIMKVNGSSAADRARLSVSVIFVAFAAIAIAGQLWYLRRIISEFRYDGQTLQFRTVGRQDIEVVRAAEITSIRDWKGKGGSLGYRLKCEDRGKLYLEFSVSNSVALANRLRAEIG